MRRSIAAAACLLAAVACGGDGGTEPATVGSIAFTMPTGSGDPLDAARVHLEGPTPRTVDVTPGTTVNLTELTPGSYTVSLEGFIGGEVDQFGRLASIQVTAGQTAQPTIPFASFRPVIGPLGLNATGTGLTIAFAPLTGATDYHVKVDHLLDFSGATEATITGTSLEVPLDENPARFIVVRATDAFGVAGRTSDTVEAQISLVPPEASLDGSVTSTGFAGSDFNAPATGDFDATNPGVGLRQFFSFDLTSAVLLSPVDAAVLRLYQASSGGTPYTDLGDVVVDHLDYTSLGLDGNDFAATADEANLGPISTDATVEYKTLTVTDEVREDLTRGRSHSQYRVRFSDQDSNNDGGDDYVQFTDEEDSCCFTGHLPELVVVTHITE